MKLAGVVSIGSYSDADLEAKKQSLKTVLRPDTQLDMFAADSGVPYIESSFEFYLSEVAVARKVVEVADMGYDAVVGTAFLDNGLDAARELVDIPVVGPAKTTLYLASTLANTFAVIMAAGDLPKHVRTFAKGLGVADRIVDVPTLAGYSGARSGSHGNEIRGDDGRFGPQSKQARLSTQCTGNAVV